MGYVQNQALLVLRSGNKFTWPMILRFSSTSNAEARLSGKKRKDDADV